MNDLWDGLESDDLSAGEQPQALRGKFSDAITARQYMRAGKATVTLVSLRTNARFTYRVSIPRDQTTGEFATDGTLMVGVLTGPDNNSNYQWLGRVSRDIFWVGRKVPRAGDISRDAPCAKAFKWAWQQLAMGTIPAELEIWHEGSCGRCGRKLTVPASIARGFGPECADKVGFVCE